MTLQFCFCSVFEKVDLENQTPEKTLIPEKNSNKKLTEIFNKIVAISLEEIGHK